MAESPPPPLLPSLLSMQARIDQLEHQLATMTEWHRLLAHACDEGRQRLQSALRARDDCAAFLSSVSCALDRPRHSSHEALLADLTVLAKRARYGGAALDVLRATHTTLVAKGQHDIAAELIMLTLGAGLALLATGDT